jgi:hypothetical protein
MQLIGPFIMYQDGPYWHLPSRDPSVTPAFVKNTELASPTAWLCVGPHAEAAVQVGAQAPADDLESTSAVWAAVERTSKNRPASVQPGVAKPYGRLVPVVAIGKKIKAGPSPALEAMIASIHAKEAANNGASANRPPETAGRPAVVFPADIIKDGRSVTDESAVASSSRSKKVEEKNPSGTVLRQTVLKDLLESFKK